MPRSRPRHDHDAGGPAELLAAKAELREEVWAALRAAKATRFPGPEGRIPNFVGAEAAAQRLRGTDVWQAAATLKANPDSPQWPVRQRALEDGKLLFMAVPRLAEPEPFFLLDPAHLAGSAREASSIKGASKSARPVGLDELKPVDLVVAGTVAAGLDGARLGKGGGFSDLEYGLLSEAGKIDRRTVVGTTVHPIQILREHLLMTGHDLHVAVVATPRAVIEVDGAYKRPGGILWDHLQPPQIHEIPVLERFGYAAY